MTEGLPAVSTEAGQEFAHLRCPQCAGNVHTNDTCHTYPGQIREDGSTQWMACLGCYSATHFYCIGQVSVEDYDFDDTGCGWEYTWGLNKSNPRSKINEQSRPADPSWSFIDQPHP